MCNEFRKTEIFDAGYKHSCICIHEIDKEREAKTVILNSHTTGENRKNDANKFHIFIQASRNHASIY